MSKWTSEEVEFLQQLMADGRSDEDIALALGRTMSAVRGKRYDMATRRPAGPSDIQYQTGWPPTIRGTCRAANMRRRLAHLAAFGDRDYAGPKKENAT